MLSITSKYGRTWLVAVTTDDIKHHYDVWIADVIPWEYWSGTLGRGINIYDGDMPIQALAQKQAAVKDKSNE